MYRCRTCILPQDILPSWSFMWTVKSCANAAEDTMMSAATMVASRPTVSLNFRFRSVSSK
jgi:hypothetical protein